jgi:hypothetical protein
MQQVVMSTELSVNQLADYFKSGHADMWNDLYPRIYTEPKCGIYASPKTPAVKLCLSTIDVEQGKEDKDLGLSFMSTYTLLRHGIPMFWLGRDMAEAISKTTPPGETNWTTRKLPFDGGIIMLPQGAITDREGRNAAHLLWNRFSTKDFAEPIPGDARPGDLRLYISVVFPGPGMPSYYTVLGTDMAAPSLSVPSLSQVASSSFSSDFEAAGDRDVVSQAVHLLFGTFALMDARPDLVTHGSLLKRVKKADGVREFWSPNVIGEHYRIKRENGLGSHASPRMHWVRGFWREQPYGPGFGMRRTQWIEPYLRGEEVN